MKVVCSICKSEFQGTNSRSRYCSDDCRHRGERAKENARRARVGVTEDLQKKLARKAVELALKHDLWFNKPEKCESCNKATNLHAHHYAGYSEPNWLKVRWLCTICHKHEHMKVAA